MSQQSNLCKNNPISFFDNIIYEKNNLIFKNYPIYNKMG